MIVGITNSAGRKISTWMKTTRKKGKNERKEWKEIVKEKDVRNDRVYVGWWSEGQTWKVDVTQMLWPWKLVLKYWFSANGLVWRGNHVRKKKKKNYTILELFKLCFPYNYNYRTTFLSRKCSNYYATTSKK